MAPPPGGQWGAPGGKPKASGQAVTAMVLGIVSCCIWIIPFVGLFLVPVLGVVAIVLAVMAMKQVKVNPMQVGGKGMAIAGLVLGIISVAFGILLLLLVFVFTAIIEDVCRENPDTPNCDAFLRQQASRATSAAGGGELASLGASRPASTAAASWLAAPPPGRWA